MNKRPNYRTMATVLAASFVPAGLAVGALVGGVLKLQNPDSVDVWNELAYLKPILLSSFAVVAVTILAALIYIVLIVKYEKRVSGSAKLPLTVLLLNLLLVSCIFFGQSLTRTAEDNWAKQNNQPTHEERDKQVDDFFKKAEEQKR